MLISTAGNSCCKQAFSVTFHSQVKKGEVVLFSCSVRLHNFLYFCWVSALGWLSSSLSAVGQFMLQPETCCMQFCSVAWSRHATHTYQSHFMLTMQYLWCFLKSLHFFVILGKALYEPNSHSHTYTKAFMRNLKCTHTHIHTVPNLLSVSGAGVCSPPTSCLTPSPTSLSQWGATGSQATCKSTPSAVHSASVDALARQVKRVWKD